MVIKRYDMTRDDGMQEFLSGDYVLFEDHEDELLNAAWHLNKLQKKHDKLVQDIDELWREG